MLIFVLASAGAGLSHAQQQAPSPGGADEKSYALSWLQGRFRAPVTCVLRDGSRVELEDSVSIRRAPKRSGMPVLRLTFFGVEVSDAEKCFNVVESSKLDRRGVLYVTYRSYARTDMGLTDFKRTLKKGELVYHIVGGQLRIRKVGTDEEPRTIHFKGQDYPLWVRPVLPQSDGDKLLAPYRDERPPAQDPRRRLDFEIEGPEGFGFRGAFIEDDRRRK